MAASFSMALGMPFALFIELIGHDGGELIGDFHKGFHLQECIDVCFKMGFSCTEIQAVYGAKPSITNDLVYQVKSTEVCEMRFDQYLADTSRGVITGFCNKNNTQVGHAVAWIDQQIFDPKGRVYTLQQCDVFNFSPQSLMIISKMGL
jgi:hypothetical protein